MPQESSETSTAQKKRAPVVCFRCHGKKIKCNLAETPAGQSCSHCLLAQSPCRPRPSRRGLGRRKSQTTELMSSTVKEGDGHVRSTAVVAPNTVRNNVPSPRPTTDGSYTHQAQPLNESYVSAEPTTATQLQSGHPANGGSQASGFPVILSPTSLRAPSTPGTQSLRSQQSSIRTSCYGNTGYMQILSHNTVIDEDRAQSGQFPTHFATTEAVAPVLKDVFTESYLQNCFVWCPVLDAVYLQDQSGADDTPLLQHALALCGSCINPPLIQAKNPALYYYEAKAIFYNDYQVNPLIRIASVMLFFWWSTGAPNLTNMDNAWWWTGIAIRIAQEAGLHREPQSSQSAQPWETAGLRRRIWWTLFARDRILSLSQGRPAVIDSDYCDVKMVSLEDFPDPCDPKAEIFVQWVKLWEIGGRIGKHFTKRAEHRTDTKVFCNDLASWVRNLPDTLSLTIGTSRTAVYNRDVHRLYVSYLTSVILLHLSKSSRLLPKASNAAIIAASCMARIFEDFLTRGTISFLSGEAGWELSVGILALLHARRCEDLKLWAEADLYVLRTALGQMALRWPSSRMFNAAVSKLSTTEEMNTAPEQNPIMDVLGESIQDAEMLEAVDGGSGTMDLFPFVTDETSPLIKAILTRDLIMTFPGLDWPLDISSNLHDLLPLDDYTFNVATAPENNP